MFLYIHKHLFRIKHSLLFERKVIQINLNHNTFQIKWLNHLFTIINQTDGLLNKIYKLSKLKKQLNIKNRLIDKCLLNLQTFLVLKNQFNFQSKYLTLVSISPNKKKMLQVKMVMCQLQGDLGLVKRLAQFCACFQWRCYLKSVKGYVNKNIDICQKE